MYHLHVKYITKSSSRSAAGVLQYIARLGAYKRRGDVVRDLIVMGMPAWVQRSDGLDFWQCADSTVNRANARLAFTIEVALPKVLTQSEQRELIVLMTQAVSDLSTGGQTSAVLMPSCAAIHEGYGRNPHVHLMISTSIPDGIERTAESWFRRYNPKAPASGGARRSRGMGTKAWLLSVRETWSKVANEFLKRHGYSLRLDHRSNKARGVESAPGIHLGPSAAYLQRVGRPSPRSQRYVAHEAERKVRERLEAEVSALKKIQRDIAAENARDQENHALIEAKMMAILDEYIEGHPFMASNERILSDMAWMVVDEGTASPRKGGGLPLPLLAQEAGDSWRMRQHQGRLFFLRPKLDGLVMVSPGVIVSDSEAPEALSLGLRLAKWLNLANPIVAAKEAVFGMCRDAIAKAQLGWSVRQHTPKPAIGANTSRTNRLSG